MTARRRARGTASLRLLGQDYTAQVEALKAAGCERIFSEKASAKNTDGRPEFLKLLKVLLPGDTVQVTKDRLARSSRDLHNIVHELDSLSVGFVSLGENWCDTTTDVGRLMLTVISGIAKFERGLIRKRTDEGIGRAKKQGKKFGRPNGLMPVKSGSSPTARDRGRQSPELAEEYGVGVGTIWRSLQPGEPQRPKPLRRK